MPDKPTLHDHQRAASLARPLRTYTCQLPECGKAFEARDSRAEWCSRRCRELAYRRRKREGAGAGGG